MRDRKWIFSGLGIFALAVLFPAWYGATAGRDATPPELELPADADACVEATAFMRAEHPVLLNEWRNAVVREGRKEYVAADGTVYTMSLTGTCMGCHTDRSTFCQRCHDYADVQPICWNCHVEPAGK